ncbi:hypothetical protein RB653_009028 [Dictyostelium firmibasis]|uniref:Uncharacterized protein n=1 Tax=Dictyostelium firmibasis TaxID=79012 RepID=A0AAN7YSV4_9MYCE
MNSENDERFFKIWRNKFIRNNILSKIKHHRNYYDSFKYEKIFSCSWMIENGYYQLLKEKVEKSENLIFNCINTLNQTNEKEFIPRNLTRKKFDSGRLIIFDINSIFNKEKAAIHWDSKFYINLFKNYPNYFLNFNKSETEFTLIEYDNQQALQVLVENFNHTLEIESFFRSLEIGSLDCSYYIFNSNNNKIKNEILKNKKNQTRIWNIILNYSIFKKEMIETKLINQRIDFVVNKLKLPIPKLSDIQSPFIPSFYDFKIYEQNLSTIIDCLKIVSQFPDVFKSFIKSINNKSYKIILTKEQEELSTTSSEELNLEISTINSLVCSMGGKNSQEFTLFSTQSFSSSTSSKDIKNEFTKQELETNISDLLASSEKNEIILALYRSLLPFTNHLTCFLDNWSFYQIKTEKNYKDYSKIKKHIEFKIDSNFHSKMFAHYNFQEFAEDCIDDNKLFQYCKNRNNQIEYINKFNNDLIMSNHPKKYNIYKNILGNLVWLDDFELISLLKKPVEVEFLPNEQSILVSKLKSNEMMDIVYKIIEMADEMDRNSKVLSSVDSGKGLEKQKCQPRKTMLEMLIFNGKSTILGYFKKNYSSDYYFQVGCIDLTTRTFRIGVYKFVYDNLSDFPIYEKVNVWRNNLHFINNVEDFKYFVERTPSDSNYKLPIDNGLTYFKYMVQERFYDLESGRCQFDRHRHAIHQYFKIIENNRLGKETEEDIRMEFYDLITSMRPFGPDTLRGTFSKICEFNDLDLIDTIFKNASDPERINSSNSKIYINSMMEVICSQGDLELFKYVYTKYPESITIILREGSKLVFIDGFFRCCRPVQIAITNGHIDLLLYILSLKKTDKVSFKPFHTSNSFNNRCLLNHFIKLKNNYLLIEE